MDSFLFAFPSDPFHINTRTLSCIFSSSIIIHLLIFLLLNTSATSPPCLLPLQRKYHTLLVKSYIYLCLLFSRTCTTLFLCLSSIPKQMLDDAKTISSLLIIIFTLWKHHIVHIILNHSYNVPRCFIA